jgi:hypothetical protein
MMSWIFALLGLAAVAVGGGAIVMGWPLVPLERGWTLVIAGSAFASGGLICLALAALLGEARRTRRAIERVLEELAWSRPIERMSATMLPAEHEIIAARPAERSYAPSPHFDKSERVTPPMPVMPAAAPLGVPEPLAEAKPVAERREARQEPRLDPHPARAAMEPSASARAAAASHPAAAESDAHEAAREPQELQPARSFSVGDTSFVVFTDGTIEARTPKGARRFGSMEQVRSYLEESAAS